MGEPGGGQRVFDMCLKALQNGYRHFDTAAGYANEKMVGKAIRASGIPRSEIFVTTKLANIDHHRVREAFELSLKELDCGYIDLYLMHWPQASISDGTAADGNFAASRFLKPDESPTIHDTWKSMEELLETGKVKALGVSNFSIKTLTQLLSRCNITPTVNQVEMHPCLPQKELKAFCDEKGIILTGYSPLGRFKTLIENETISAIAQKVKAKPAQVILSWAVQRGTTVVPKSEDNERMITNITLVKLPADDMKTIDQLHEHSGMHRSLLKYHAPNGMVFGWTYEDLGWNMTVGGIAR